jgi:hypothetical protein
MGIMSVTEYLTRARECADIAERIDGADKHKLLEIADAWLKLAADEAARAAAQSPIAVLKFAENETSAGTGVTPSLLANNPRTKPCP